MKQTFSVLFIQKKNPKNIDKPQSIVVRITVNGKSVEIFTKLKCGVNQWDSKQHKIVGNDKSCSINNAILNNIRTRINQIYYQQTLYGEITTAQNIKDTFTGANKKQHYLLSLFETHNENIRKQVGISKSSATFQKYEVTRKHMQKFLSEKSLKDIHISKIDYQFICDFEIYLRVTASCGHNTTAKFMQFFKRIIIIALNNNYITKNPFQEYQIRLEKVDREYLTKDELQTICRKK